MSRRPDRLAATGRIDADYRVLVVRRMRSKYEYSSIPEAERALSVVDVTSGAYEVFDTEGFEWLPVPTAGGVRLERLRPAPERARYALNVERYGGRLQVYPHTVAQLGSGLMLVGILAGSWVSLWSGLLLGSVGVLVGWALYRAADRRGWIIDPSRRARPWWDGWSMRRRGPGGR